MKKEDFDFETVEESASSAKYLCAWCLTMHKYLTHYFRVKPQLVAFEELKSSFERKRSYIREVEAELARINAEIELFTRRQRQAEDEKEEIVAHRLNTLKKIDRIKQLLQYLSPQSEDWDRNLEKLEQRSAVIIGNSLLAAAAVEYLGVLKKPLRKKLGLLWQKVLAKNKVRCSANFLLHKFIGSKQEIYTWRLAGLPPSSLNLENASILHHNNKPKVIFDPNDTCLSWLNNMASRGERGIFFSSLADSKLSEKLQVCLERGQLIVIDFFNGDLTGVLASLLSPVTRQVEGQQTIKIDEMWYNYDPRFDFYLLTRDRAVLKKTDVQAMCCLIKFSLDDEGLEKSIRATITEIFSPEEQRAKFERQNELLQRKSQLYQSQENILIRLIVSGDEVLFSDDEYVEMLVGYLAQLDELERDFAGELDLDREDDQVSEQNLRSPISSLHKVLLEVYKINERFAAEVKSLQISAKSYLRVASLVIRGLGLQSANDFNKQNVLLVCSQVFNVLAGGASSETRLFLLIDLCVSILKIYNEFKQPVWDYIIMPKKPKSDSSLQSEVENSVWQTLQNLRSLIPSIEMEQLPGYVQIFQQIPAIGMRAALRLAMEKAHQLNSLEKLALCISFLPENFHLCLATFTEDILPHSSLDPPILEATLPLCAPDQPAIHIQSGMCDYAHMLAQLSAKLGAPSHLIYCANSSWETIRAALDVALKQGQVILLSEFGIVPDIHEATSRYLREIGARPGVDPRFKLVLATTPDEGSLSVELISMALKVYEEADEASLSFESYMKHLDVAALSKAQTKLVNIVINLMLAFAVVVARSRFDRQGRPS